MKTQPQTSEERVYIQWNKKTQIKEQFKSFADFAKTHYLTTHANNFGYNHLVEREILRWSKYKVHNIFIVDADVQYNYGLDFKMYLHYTADGITFFRELTIGSSAITASPLIRVMLFHKLPTGLDINNFHGNSPELLAEWFDNMNNNIYDAFCFSTNAFYNKGREFRNELRELSAKSEAFIFADAYTIA